VSLGDSNNDLQPEMATETGNTYIFKTMRESIEISTANLGFTITDSSKKCQQVFATAGDNRIYDMVAKTGNIYICGTVRDSIEMPTANLELFTMASSIKVSQGR